MSAAVVRALEERLARERRRSARPGIADRLVAIGRLTAARPVLDCRSADELLDHDEHGLPR
jgi:hypothetical protein